MKAIIGKFSLLALVAGLSGGALIAGCSSSSDKPDAGKNEGAVGFNLDVGGGASVSTMHVVVFGNGLGTEGASTNIVKNVDVGGISGSSAPFTLVLPAGTNYQIKVTSPDNATCLGTGTFSVTAGGTAGLSLTMSCTPAATTGTTPVTVDACSAAITQVFVAPTTTSVGHKIITEALATPGATFLWSTTGNGTFDSATAASTNFNCTSVGSPTLTITVSGSNTAGAACTASKTFAVNCTAGTGGSGGATGAGGSGTGGSGTGGSTGGSGTGGSGTGGSTGGSGTGGSGTGGSGTGGSGTGGSGTGGSGTGGATGVPDPIAALAPACAACETSSNVCANFRPCDRFGTQVDSQGRLKADTCREVLTCVINTGCAGVGVEGDCYCGTASGPACDSGMGNGACRTAIEHGADSTSPSVIQSSFTATSLGGGMALSRVVCLNGGTCQGAGGALSAND